MLAARHKAWSADVGMEAVCRRILERHRETVRVQNHDIAVANLSRIIEATLTLSNKQGFHATSLRDLARESGVSMGGLYSYIESKSTLLSMILREVYSTVVDIMNAPPAHLTSDPLAHLRWMIDTHIRLSEAMLPWFVFTFMEARFFPPAERRIALEAEAATERLFAEVVARGVASGVFGADEAGLAASLIKPLLQDWYVKRAKYRKRGVPLAAYSAAVTQFVEAALSPKQRSAVPLASGDWA